MMPLVDMINHSFEPNVSISPFEDKINDESYVLVQALKGKLT